MATPFNWDSLDDWDAWKAKLTELLRQGRTALEQQDDPQLTDTETTLQAFIEHNVAYDDLRSEAKAGLGELLTADIRGLINRLDALSKQLPAVSAEGVVAAQPSARWHLAQAFSSVAALREQHRQLPYAHPALEQQLSELLSTMQELLDAAPPAAPPAAPRRKKTAPRRPASE